MSIYKQLDQLIEEYASNHEEYCNMKDEMICHLEGDLPYDLLSDKTKKVIIDWEMLVQQESTPFNIQNPMPE